MKYWMSAAAMLCLVACNRDRRNDSIPAATPAAVGYEIATGDGPDAQIAHGERMAVIYGCKACHGDNLQGDNVTESDPEFGDMNAPNLTLLMASYSDSNLERVIRRGVPKDEREFWFMPSESFQYASDSDVAALTAYLRTVKPGGKPMPPIRKGPLLHKQVAEGLFDNARVMVDRFQKSQPVDLGEQHALGRHIAMTVCTECHNSELQGYDGFSPNLDIAGAYSLAELETLLATGKGKAKPDLGLMTKAAQLRFSKLTPNERSSVAAYVKARADRGK